LDVIEDIDIDIPFGSKYAAKFIASAMSFDDNPLPLSFLHSFPESLIPTGKAAAMGTEILSLVASHKVSV
jgi:hypothetical protein